MKKQIYRVLFIALLALMQTTWVQAQVNSEVRKVPPGAPVKNIANVTYSSPSLIQGYNERYFTQGIDEITQGSAEEGAENHRLTVNFDYDMSKYQVVYYGVNNINGRFSEDYTEKTPFRSVFSLPSDTYDVFVGFVSRTSIYLWYQYYFIIKENISIDDDVEITVSPQDAVNKVEIKTYLANGEEAKTDCYNTHELDETGTWLLQQSGNVNFISDLGYIIGPYNVLGFGDNQEDFRVDLSEDRHSSFYINDVSDRYSIHIYEVIQDHNNDYYTTCFEKKGGEAELLQNSPDDYVLYEQQFSQSEYGKQTVDGYRNYFKCMFIEHIDEIGKSFAVYPVNAKGEETTKVYMGKAPMSVKVDALVFLGRLDSEIKEEFHDEWGETWEETISKTMVYGQPFFQKEGNTERINNGISSLHLGNGFNCYKNEEGIGYYDTNSHNPILSYMSEKIKGIQGNNVPILTHVNTIRTDQNHIYTVIAPYYLGRYGEINHSDNKIVQMEIVHDGETLVSSTDTYPDALFEEDLWWAEDTKLSGVIDLTLTCGNRVIDGLEGKNLTTIHYDRDQEDSSAPVLQMLHFKDGEGYITDRFKTTEGTLLELFAGDFTVGYEEINPYFILTYFDRAKAKSVNVAYAPYGKDNWTDLTLEENPEYYSNLMGWYYAASLEDVAGAAEKGWFDLKIRLEDEAGNWQEQVISPAFQIKSLVDTGISQLTIDNGQLTIPGNENVYDLMGRCIGNAPSSTDKGIRIVRKANGDVRKVILR